METIPKAISVLTLPEAAEKVRIVEVTIVAQLELNARIFACRHNLHSHWHGQTRRLPHGLHDGTLLGLATRPGKVRKDHHPWLHVCAIVYVTAHSRRAEYCTTRA